jgi:DNA-directed RNA polymerase specialized sigma24 family protein
MSDSNSEMPSSSFPTTQWTVIIKVIQEGADDAAWKALSAFCEQYRPAIYGFFRRRGCSHERADEYTQDFFLKRIHARWDDKEGFLFKAKKGEQRRFRGFLCHVLWAFLKDQWKAEGAEVRGGGKVHVPMDGLDFSDAEAEARTVAAISCDLDREVGLEIIKRAAGDTTRSHYLLTHFQDRISQAEAAKELGMSEGAFRKAFFDFRQRFPVNLRKEVAKLVGPDPKDIEEEIKYLMRIFSQSAS